MSDALSTAVTVAVACGYGAVLVVLVERLVATRTALRRVQASLVEADETIRELMAQSRRMAELAVERAVALQIDTRPMRQAIDQADASRKAWSRGVGVSAFRS